MMFSERTGRTLSYTHCHAISQLHVDNDGINKHITETEKTRKKENTNVHTHNVVKGFPFIVR